MYMYINQEERLHVIPMNVLDKSQEEYLQHVCAIRHNNNNNNFNGYCHNETPLIPTPLPHP